MPNEVLIKIRVKDESAAGYEEALAEARGFGGKLAEELKHAGERAGDDAAEEIKHKLEEVNPPEIDIGVKTEEAKAEIHEVEDDLERLERRKIKIDFDLDSEKVMLEADTLKERLKRKFHGDDGAGKDWAKAFTDSLSHFDFKPGLMPVGIAIGAAFSPLLGASIAGLVVGGFGLGGIVGGVMLAAKDPRVKAAFGDMKKDLGASLKLDAAPFVPVVIEGIDAIKNTVKGLNLGGIFADLAPQVRPVLSGILDLVSSLGSALANIAKNSGPVLKELGTDFRNLGSTLEAGLNSLTDNSHQEAQALHDLFGVIDGGITLVFDLVNALTELYGAFHKVIDLSLIGFYELMQDHSQKVTGAVDAQVTAVLAAVDADHSLAGASKAAADAAAGHAKEIKDVSDALRAQTDPAFALVDAQKQVNDATSNYNKTVKANGENSTKAKNAQEELQKALINYVGAAANARTGTGHLTDEQKALLKSAGASDGTIKNLDRTLQNAYKSAKKLDGFKVDVDYNINVYAKIHGANASAALQHDKDLNALYGLAHGGVKGAASGATSSGLTWVGEQGPELMDLPPGTTVHTAGDSRRMAGGGNGQGQTIIVPLTVDGHTLATVVIDPVRKIVRQLYGGSAQAALGVGA